MLSDQSIQRDGNYEFPYRIVQKIRKILTKSRRTAIRAKNTALMLSEDFTIFSNNCLGGVIYHDLGKEFTSPLINTAMDGEDFVRFLERPQYYLSQEMTFISWPGHEYPIARIDDIEVRFVHYKTPEEAEAAFRRRAERILWDRIVVIATNHDGLNSDVLMDRFHQLPYKKVMYVSHEYPQYDWAVCVPQFKGRFQVRIMTGIANLRGERYYETAFDLISWLRK